MLSVILPASNEASYIAACLTALLASKGITHKAEVIVVANGCHDDTAAIARSFTPGARAAGWQLTVVELAEGSKPAALNAGDAVARYPLRLYLDADVTVTPTLVAELLQALQDPAPCYVSGTPHIPRPHSAISRSVTSCTSSTDRIPRLAVSRNRCRSFLGIMTVSMVAREVSASVIGPICRRSLITLRRRGARFATSWLSLS